MKLLNDFFYIVDFIETDKAFVYSIKLNKDHRIYQVHFPNNPVTPGACLVQITKELLEKQLSCTVVLRKIVNLKFIKILTPTESSLINVELSISQNADEIKVSANFKLKETIYTKQTLIFIKNDDSSIQKQMDGQRVCVIIPTFNNDKLIRPTLNEFILYTKNIIVVNDGSNDHTKEILEEYPEIHTISYSTNHGKGYALNKGFDLAEKLGYEYAITADSDGQHKAYDLSIFMTAITQYPNQFIVGNRNIEKLPLSKGSKFANKFSNFWFTVQTGLKLPDTQTGFRAYPLKAMNGMRAITSRYEAEIELMVRMAWKGINIDSVPIHVYYPTPEKRISHFRPIIDFARISLLNSILVIFAIVYGYPSRLFHKIMH